MRSYVAIDYELFEEITTQSECQADIKVEEITEYKLPRAWVMFGSLDVTGEEEGVDLM
jgi:hypothetical protein